jgi:hypothetical protein
MKNAGLTDEMIRQSATDFAADNMGQTFTGAGGAPINVLSGPTTTGIGGGPLGAPLEAQGTAFSQGTQKMLANPNTTGFKQLGSLEGAKNVYNAMPTGTLPALGATVASSMMPEAPKIPGEEEEDPRYKGSPYRYNLASNFAGSTPATPNPYYNPTGLGYGAQGGSTDDIMMAAGGSYDDEPMGDDFAMGGSIGGYSDGGRMLKGPGDGMSDSIPATIGKRQPARLADGEFVVPADVVSHLGNGSTDAGAKHLYSMMDKVRKARTGTKKQGKQIKSEKYMPA